MEEQPFFRPPKFLEENDRLLDHFYALVGSTGPLSSAWLLALNQVAAAHPGLAPHLPIGSPDPTTQRGVEFLGSSLNVLRITPVDYLLERLQVDAPDLVRVCGRFLLYNLENCMLRDIRQRSYWIPGSYAPALSEKRNSCLWLWKNKGSKEERITKVALYAISTSTTLESNKSLRQNLGFPPERPFQWRGEYLTADNPIRIGPHSAGKTNVDIPDDASGTHRLQFKQYTDAFRPRKQPGRPRKPRDAPRTPRRTGRLDEARARQAASLHQQGAHWTAIALVLWRNTPVPTEKKAREALRQRVKRLIQRGLLHAVS